jgi:hypothetical protein
MLKMEQEARSLGLGDAVQVAETMSRKSKELGKELKVSPLKGVRHPSTTVLRQQREQAVIAKRREREENPVFRNMGGIPGLITEPDGSITLRELKRQRPDIFSMRPMPVEGRVPRAEIINRLILKKGLEDKYYDERYGNKS